MLHTDAFLRVHIRMVSRTPSILLFPSDTREDPVVPSQPDPQCLAPEYRTLKAESDSDDDEVPYSPLTTYHDPTPLSSPQARSTHLLRAELRASARSKSSAASDDYAIDDDDHTIESDSGSDYEPESRATVHRKRRAGPATRPKKSHTRSRARARSFNSADTPSLTPSPLSVASSIPSSPGTNLSSLRAGRLRSLQVTSTSVPFSRRCSICRYEPPRNCKAEMARHMNTHTYEQRTRMHGHDWFCCGVPVARAEEFNITDVSDARTWEDMNSLMGNRLMVGGCGQSFVRRDSYGRHLNGKRCVCVGDSKADWVPGNMRPRSGSFSSSE